MNVTTLYPSHLELCSKCQQRQVLTYENESDSHITKTTEIAGPS